jgi:hypothetical protein
MPGTVKYKKGFRLNEHEHIAEDVHCRACRYNWRGLDPAGRCPECGDAIDARNTLEHLRSRQADGLRTSLGWMGAVVVVCVALFFAATFFGCLAWAAAEFFTGW